MNDQNYNFGNQRSSNNTYNNGMQSFDHMNQNFRNGQKYQKYNQNYAQNANQNMNMYNSYVNKENITSSPPKEKVRWGKVFLPIIIVLAVLTLSFTGYQLMKGSNKKNRTIMVYMVGSDLESQSKQGTLKISLKKK